MPVGALPHVHRSRKPLEVGDAAAVIELPKKKTGVIDAMLPTEAATRTVVAVGPVPEIDRLLETKPDARIALVQGSFDWIHNGHLDLISAVAASKSGKTQEPFDLVVVMPTTSNSDKGFLADHVHGRLELIKQALASREDLRGRAVFSDAAIKNRSPDGLMRQLLDEYGTARFTFVQGADAFNQSSKWPTFAVVEDNMELAVVPRAGVLLENPERIDALIEVQPTAVSSSEIRKALEAGDLSAIEGRVPACTLTALRRELARRHDPAAATLQWFAA